jgi:CDP-diacylglycerol---glycerol-3-phosphate 3-phosphatidyltransferase
MPSDKPLLTPNQITVYRFYLIFPLFLGWFLSEDVTVRIVIALLFALVFVADCWDGLVASKYKMNSVFGAYFDPIVDHISYFALCIMFIDAGFLTLWFLFLMITRDFLVVFIKQLAGSQNKVISASILAKVKADLISVPLAGVYLMAVVPESYQIFVIAGTFLYLLGLPIFFDFSKEHTKTIRITLAVLGVLFLLRPDSISLPLYYEYLYMGMTLIFSVGSGFEYFWSNREFILQESA